MQLRKLIWLHGSSAITLPAAFLRQLEAGPGDYMEISLQDDKTLMVRRHSMPDERKKPHAGKAK